MKRSYILLFCVVVSVSAIASCKVETDTLLKVEKLFVLQIKNASYLPPYQVSGDIYLTSDRFVFKPKSYFGKKVSSFYPLLREINISYDSIIVTKRFWLIPPFIRLVIKTKHTEYKFDYFMRKEYMFKMRKTIREIIKISKEQKKQ